MGCTAVMPPGRERRHQARARRFYRDAEQRYQADDDWIQKVMEIFGSDPG
jgi:hypothetical protein